MAAAAMSTPTAMSTAMPAAAAMPAATTTPAKPDMSWETVAPATMALVARKGLLALVVKVAVAMIPTVVPAFPATAIERAIGRIAVGAAVVSAFRASGQEETDANQERYRRLRYSAARHRSLHFYEVRQFRASGVYILS
jgi:hypothetical protein